MTQQRNPTTERTAVVVGAGIIGLTTAIALSEDGWQVRVVAADPPERTTSAVAAGMWHPGSGGGRVIAWARRSYAVYTGEAEASEARGVLVRRGLELFGSPQPEPDWASIVGGVRRPAPERFPAGYADAHEFSAPIIDMPAYLAWLLQRLNEADGTLELHTVTSLTELDPSPRLVVNCAGLNGGALVGDNSVVPVRVETVRVMNPGLRRFLRDDSNPSFRTYIYPRGGDCVLGGTSERGRCDVEPDSDVTARILGECRRLEPALADAEVIGPLVGLAPWRPTVRLELQHLSEPPGVVVHNYGHGGAGITLAWGCAEEVVALARTTTESRR